MPLYRKKPVTIDAYQWLPGDTDSFKDVRRGAGLPAHHPAFEIAHELGLTDSMSWGWLETLEGGHIVQPGDWIITGVAGEKYPCKDAIFQATYEPA